VVVLLVAFLVLVSTIDDPIELLRQNWFITPIAFLAAAFANATAIGGGFLFIPLFIFVYGLTPLVALKLSLATQAFGMTSGAIGWSRQFIDPVALLVGGLASLAGVAFGTLVLLAPSEMIKPAFGWSSFLIFVALLLELRFGSGAQNQRISQLDWRLYGYAIVAFIGGLVTAWTAIGVGEFVAIYLLFVYGIRIEVSIATGVAILALDSILGLALHGYLGGVPWDLLLFTAPGVLLGGYSGAKAGKYLEYRTRSSGVFHPDFQHSPLKLLFAAIILIDSMSILANHYLVNSRTVLVGVFD
jgi:uncharacterized membrane protein YfcA